MSWWRICVVWVIQPPDRRFMYCVMYKWYPLVCSGGWWLYNPSVREVSFGLLFYDWWSLLFLHHRTNLQIFDVLIVRNPELWHDAALALLKICSMFVVRKPYLPSCWNFWYVLEFIRDASKTRASTWSKEKFLLSFQFDPHCNDNHSNFECKERNSLLCEVFVRGSILWTGYGYTCKRVGFIGLGLGLIRPVKLTDHLNPIY